MRCIDEIEERAKGGYGADPDETLMLINKIFGFLRANENKPKPTTRCDLCDHGDGHVRHDCPAGNRRTKIVSARYHTCTKCDRLIKSGLYTINTDWVDPQHIECPTGQLS